MNNGQSKLMDLKFSSVSIKFFHLFQKLTEKTEDQQSRFEEGQQALSSLEEYKVLEVQLREEVARLESTRIDETTKLQTELIALDKKLESDVSSYKEQIKQHSVTICAMEERITKVMKKNKECQEEIESNHRIIQGICFICTVNSRFFARDLFS